MFACFFQTNFPNIPFLKLKLLSFWLFIYFFCCFCFCFHISCFCLSVLMLALFLVCFILLLFCFSFVSCFAFTDYEKHCFPCNSSVFSHAGYKVVLYFFQFHVFFACLFFCFCVVCFHFRHLICIMLCLCCLVFFFLITGLSGFVVCILWSSFLLLFCFEFCLFFCFFIPLKKDPPKNRTQQKPKKSKHAEKTEKSVSAVVFTDSVLKFCGVGSKISFFG